MTMSRTSQLDVKVGYSAFEECSGAGGGLLSLAHETRSHGDLPIDHSKPSSCPETVQTDESLAWLYLSNSPVDGLDKDVKLLGHPVTHPLHPSGAPTEQLWFRIPD